MQNQPLFREILVSDLPTIFAVRIATWHNANGAEELNQMGITVDSVKDMLLRTHRGWLCECNSKIVGFAMGNVTTGEMWVIAVLKEFEGLGIGKQLLTMVEDWLFQQGWREIWLTTDPDETYRAVGFYKHLGWVDWKLESSGDRYMKKTSNIQ